jgi:hypothetical protein
MNGRKRLIGSMAAVVLIGATVIGVHLAGAVHLLPPARRVRAVTRGRRA